MPPQILSLIAALNHRKVWNVSLLPFVGSVILVSGQKPIDAALATHAGFLPAYLAALYDGFVTWAALPTLVLSGAGLAVGKPPLPPS
ncbi:MAG: hypothetical protein KGL39_29250 [Patescibacteria group bacterium]|nr:hypothetical protein [Patescibacteria group bacterium]